MSWDNNNNNNNNNPPKNLGGNSNNNTTKLQNNLSTLSNYLSTLSNDYNNSEYIQETTQYLIGEYKISTDVQKKLIEEFITSSPLIKSAVANLPEEEQLKQFINRIEKSQALTAPAIKPKPAAKPKTAVPASNSAFQRARAATASVFGATEAPVGAPQKKTSRRHNGNGTNLAAAALAAQKRAANRIAAEKAAAQQLT